MSGRTASPPPPLVPEPVTPDDYKELLRHLNPLGHIVVLNRYVPERPKKTWGQFLKRTNAPVPDDVLYKEDIRDLMYELETAIKTKTRISESASKKLASINAMLHRINSRSLTPSVGSSASTVSSPQQQSHPNTFDDNWLTRVMGRAQYRNRKEEEETQKRIDAQAKWENDNSALALRLEAYNRGRDADLAKLDNEKLLAEFQVYKSKGGPFDMDGWKKTRHYGTTADPWPDMTVPGEVGKPNSSNQFANLLGHFRRSGGKSKRSKSNKGKKSHRSRSNCRRSTCRRSTCRRSTCRRR
jgi:hypothetical protein